jgi:hypothetical protein
MRHNLFLENAHEFCSLVRDGSEAVKARVSKRLEKSIFLRPVKNHAAQAASDLTTPKMVVQQLSQQMMRKLPKKMKEKGLTVEMEEVFREGPFVVLQLQVIHVDTVALAARKSKEDDALSSMIQWFLNLMGAGYQKNLEEDYCMFLGTLFAMWDPGLLSGLLTLPRFSVPKQVMKHLAVEMPAMLEEKMASKKVEAETKVLDGKSQARYFYSKLKEVRELEEIRKNKNPIRKIRKKMSVGASLDEDDTYSSREDGR